MSLRSRLGTAAAVISLAGASVLVPVSAASATAASCGLSVLGQAAQVKEPNGHVLGQFYEGYDSCNYNVYAEFHFSSTSDSANWDIHSYIEINHSGTSHWNGSPNGVLFWDSPAVSIYSAPSSDRVYYANFDLSYNGSTKCQGSAAWSFSGYSVAPASASCTGP